MGDPTTIAQSYFPKQLTNSSLILSPSSLLDLENNTTI